jgi:integrase/recombinase XerD
MAKKGEKKSWPFLAPSDPEGMPALRLLWLEALKTRGYSEAYVGNCESAVSLFTVWCQERGITKAKDVTKPILESYQRWLFYFRREKRRADAAGGDEPLSIRTQLEKLSSLKGFFRWLSKQGYILANPASELELPRIPPRRPPEVLTIAEVEQVLAQPDLSTAAGVRDRAILETLYSTGMRRKELSKLAISDIETSSGIVRVRHGKGKRERLIPIGSRALAWIHRYLVDARPQLATTTDDGTLFLTVTGKAFWPDNLTDLARRYVKAAGVVKPGSCHLFRHTMATLMLENGADIRFIQEMLGHATLQATEVYTHVSIKALKEIHTATHPGAGLEGRREEDRGQGELFSSLAAERPGGSEA